MEERTCARGAESLDGGEENLKEPRGEKTRFKSLNGSLAYKESEKHVSIPRSNRIKIRREKQQVMANLGKLLWKKFFWGGKDRTFTQGWRANWEMHRGEPAVNGLEPKETAVDGNISGWCRAAWTRNGPGNILGAMASKDIRMRVQSGSRIVGMFKMYLYVIKPSYMFMYIQSIDKITVGLTVDAKDPLQGSSAMLRSSPTALWTICRRGLFPDPVTVSMLSTTVMHQPTNLVKRSLSHFTNTWPCLPGHQRRRRKWGAHAQSYLPFSRGHATGLRIVNSLVLVEQVPRNSMLVT